MDDPSQRRIPHTYDQAAAVLGIQPEAVRARRRRGDLTRGPDTNDRRPTVLLSEAEIAAIRARVRTIRPEAVPASTPEAAPDPTGRPDGHDRTVQALEDALALLRDQLGEDRTTLEAAVVELKARAERAELQASAEGARADRAEAERDAERVRAAQAEREREAARVAAAEAAGEIRGLREALSEARRPWWRRWSGR